MRLALGMLIVLTALGCHRELDGGERRHGRQSAGDTSEAPRDGDYDLEGQGDSDARGDNDAAGDGDTGGDSIDQTGGGDAPERPICGDGIVEGNETCDDGAISEDCDVMHDGGDGSCVPPDTCSDGYVLDGGSCVAETAEQHVHIYVDNFCNLSVDPPELDVVSGRRVSLTYHNHSVDYDVDVWLSYGGGYLGLEPGTSWDDQFVHCWSGDRPYDAAADISISGLGVNDPYCPGHRMLIHCE